MSKWPIFEPQDSSADLFNHPHRRVLIQNPAGLVYLALCPNCGKTASQRILGSKGVSLDVYYRRQRDQLQR